LRFESFRSTQRNPIAQSYDQDQHNILDRFDFPMSKNHPSWTDRVTWLEQNEHLRASRERIAEILTAYNMRHNNTPEVIASLEKLRDPRALVVTGGQQACLFTGPSFVVYKAITIIQTARQCEAMLGRPMVPVFWIAGEDHDWDEVRQTHILTPQLTIERIMLENSASPSAKRTSISRTPIALETWKQAIEAMSQALPGTEFKEGLICKLERIAFSSTTLVEAFAKSCSLLFGSYGLLVLDSDDPALRELEAPMFREIITHHQSLTDALKLGEQAVAAAGFPIQAQTVQHGLQLFMFHDGERKLLYRDGNQLFDRKRTIQLEVHDAIRLVEQQPQNFSNNVFTRPLMQEYLLPCLAVVLGPSEIAYWSTLKEAFHLFSLRQPVVVPRTEITLVEGTVQKQIDKLGLTMDDVYTRLDVLRQQWLNAQDTHRLDQRFAQVRTTFIEMYQPLVTTAESINPSLKKLGETNLDKIIEQIRYFEARTHDAALQQHEAGLRHWDRIRHSIVPHGKPQERVLNFFQYIVKYGQPWFDQLMEQWLREVDPHQSTHYVLYT
jgi:bacillithiol biosynthesis cysteine-adding enzyme BshC